MRRAIVVAARPSARIWAIQRSSSSVVASATGPSRKAREGGQVAPVRVHRPRRALRGEKEQEALDIGV